MARRRSDATLTILFMGLLSIALFGAVIVYYSQQTPILRLRPELEQHYRVAGFEARFISGVTPWIEVVPPAGFPLPDEYARTRLACWALGRYRALTEERTQVVECHLLPQDGTQTVVDTEMVFMLERAEASLEELAQALVHEGLTQPEVEVLGVVMSGAHIVARAHAPQGLSEEARHKTARRAAEVLGRFTFVSKARVEVLAPGGAKVQAEGGRDVPRERPKKPGK